MLFRSNNGELDPEILKDIVLSFAKKMKEDILQRFHRNKSSRTDKKFAEFILIEAIRGICCLTPVLFYHLLEKDEELRKILSLKLLKTLGNYRDFDRKRKTLKVRMKKISKRNLKTKGSEVYVLDTFIVEMDLNRYRKGKKIKKAFDAEFLHSTAKGTVVGIQAAALMNITKFSLEKLEIYPIDTAKKRIYKEMVTDEIGSERGKIKTLIADGGFFAYDNYKVSINRRIVPIIKPRSNCRKNLKKELRSMTPNVRWFDEEDARTLELLLEEFEEIIKSTIEKALNYEILRRRGLK